MGLVDEAPFLRPSPRFVRRSERDPPRRHFLPALVPHRRRHSAWARSSPCPALERCSNRPSARGRCTDPRCRGCSSTRVCLSEHVIVDGARGAFRGDCAVRPSARSHVSIPHVRRAGPSSTPHRGSHAFRSGAVLPSRSAVFAPSYFQKDCGSRRKTSGYPALFLAGRQAVAHCLLRVRATPTDVPRGVQRWAPEPPGRHHRVRQAGHLRPRACLRYTSSVVLVYRTRRPGR